MTKRWIARLGLGLVSLLAFTTTGFVGWAVTGGEPEPEALSALQSDEAVTVTNGDLLVFMPTTDPAPVGYVFYPSGRVEPEAFARTLRPIAEAGYPVVVVRMPLDLAVLAPNRAHRALDSYPTVERWVMGGHSLGGAMAANFVYNHPDTVEGLVLLASYPPGSAPLTGWDGAVLSMVGSRDGVSPLSDIEARRNLLPPQTQYTIIEGGNHAQFADYGTQRDDFTATISAEAQQQQAIEATLALLERTHEQYYSVDSHTQ